MELFADIYKSKNVLVTGHTGFKGSWLTSWLLKLGAEVIGVSNGIPTKPSMFEVLGLENKIVHEVADIRDLEAMKKIVTKYKPDFVFHMAAQAIVSYSYSDPLETISTNVIGTANVLEALRLSNHECVLVDITSDKCYENVEWIYGYKETDALGGKDVYSASKGAAEVVFHSYYKSFFASESSNIKAVSVRAGNVIGGGDWALDRIVPDCMRAWSKGESVEIRCPDATRPWQHVLEPLSGYLTVGQQLYANHELNGESFNFGPNSTYNHTVKDLLEDLSKFWDFESSSEAYRVTGNIPFHEAGLLKLNCDKALFYLKWIPTLRYSDVIELISEWYYKFYNTNNPDMYEITLDHISRYEEKACKQGIKWTISQE